MSGKDETASPAKRTKVESKSDGGTRKIIVLSFISLDGVMQAPGGPDEDTASGFTLGGWTFPYFEEKMGEEMTKQMQEPFDLLLGRKTFDIFAGYWPAHQHQEHGKGINNANKFVVSNTHTQHSWQHSNFLSSSSAEELVEKISALKTQAGPDLQVHGSAELIQFLLKNDLADELWLKTFPVILGKGKKLFGEGANPRAWTLYDSKCTPTGVLVANYKRAGDVKTGTFG